METARKARGWLVLIVYLLLFPADVFAKQAVTADDLIYLSENFPPHNYEVEGRLQGASVEILELIWARLGAKKTRKDIQLVPWARGMKIIEESHNAVLFGMGYTPERAERFNWVGPYYAHSLALLAKKTNHIRIGNFEDASSYTVGVVREDVGHQMLIKRSFNPEKLEIINNLDSLYKMIDAERVQLACYVVPSFFRHIETQGGDPSRYEEVFEIAQMKSGFGFSKKVPRALIEEFQNSLDDLIRSNAIDPILMKYHMK